MTSEGPLTQIKRLSVKVADLRNTDPSNRFTSLAYAVQKGREDVVRFLLELGHEDEELSRVSDQPLPHTCTMKPFSCAVLLPLIREVD